MKKFLAGLCSVRHMSKHGFDGSYSLAAICVFDHIYLKESLASLALVPCCTLPVKSGVVVVVVVASISLTQIEERWIVNLLEICL